LVVLISVSSQSEWPFLLMAAFGMVVHIVSETYHIQDGISGGAKSNPTDGEIKKSKEYY